MNPVPREATDRKYETASGLRPAAEMSESKKNKRVNSNRREEVGVETV